MKGTAITYFDLLGQRDTWIDHHGTARPITDLHPDDAWAARLWLDRNAAALAAHVAAHVTTLSASDLPDGDWIPRTPDTLAWLTARPADWIAYTPLGDALGGHSSETFKKIEDRDIPFWTIWIGGHRRWVFGGCKNPAGYANPEDAAVEAECQLTGKTQGWLGATAGHGVTPKVHRTNWLELVEPLVQRAFEPPPPAPDGLLPDDLPVPAPAVCA
ncbi:hypothetical protein [Planomonospora sp. ID82291]|uniref:hypothetical protein n=1 Tax=Planomonospora sp. ID82291 TaxID=2738136 RepID=UPI0018C37640|nr:hypothetical protein [Planomonospora sp. ID82291]MBG0818261.1 hypothetical protein [Planomonospora sp. ID82291]